MNTNGEGVAVCSFGSELHVVCSGGCPEPDVVFKSELASLRKPKGTETSNRMKERAPRRPGQCTVPGCEDDRAPRRLGRGRPPTKCQRHLDMQRVCRERYAAKFDSYGNRVAA